MLWCLLGIVAGVIFGIIPGAGPFLAVATLYPFLAMLDPFDILIFYVALIITTNYTNSVTGILYGIPGDAAAVTTARYGHKMLLEGTGHYAVSSNAVSSTIGSIFAIGIFLLFLSDIFNLFKFYNSTIQVVVILFAVAFLVLLSQQAKWKTILLFIAGGVLAKIGFDNLTYETWGTLGFDYLTLGVPFSSVMICLYIVPEILKFKDKEFVDSNRISKFGYDWKTIPATLLGGFIGFWSGLIPGVTNILGSYLSSNLVKSDINKIAAAESANNSGALSSLLPLIILGIPIVSSEVLVYYLVLSRGFTFDIENLHVFSSILYFIPLVLIVCLFLSWLCFNQLGNIARLYKKYKYIFTAGIVIFISAMSIYIYPIKEWIVISMVLLAVPGYLIRKWDTFPILYGFFLTDLFWNNLMRVVAIYS
jgi:putative tricarboxylic transport membrane protein